MFPGFRHPVISQVTADDFDGTLALPPSGVCKAAFSSASLSIASSGLGPLLLPLS